MSRSDSTEDLATRPMIIAVIDAFYAKVRQDRALGPVFDAIIGDNWTAHLEKIASFWLTATRIERSYHGRDFMPAHLRHASIAADLLPRWLELFTETCDELCPPAAAEQLVTIAKIMAENLAMSLERRDGRPLAVAQ